MRVPAAFSFSDVFRCEFDDVPTTTVEKENLKNTAYYILNALVRYRYDGRALRELEKTGYLPLNADLLKANCDNRYKRVLEVLCREGVVEAESQTYGPGRSRRYRLSPAMDRSAPEFKELDGTIQRRYLKHQVAGANKAEIGENSLKHLTVWLKGTRLTARVEDLHYFIEAAFPRVQALVARSGYPPEDQAELLGRAVLRVNHQLDSIRRLVAGEFRPSNTGRDERLHSLLVRMKRELRSFLLYDGQPLVSLDVRSSQPYLLLVLLSKEFYKRAEANSLSWASVVSGRNFSNHHILITPDANHPSYYSKIPLVLSELSDTQFAKKQVFPKIAWSEGFYKDFARKVTGGEPTPPQVEKMKEEGIWMFFEPKAKKFNSRIFAQFQHHYPVEAAAIRAVHKLAPKLLPLLLQRLEARILLHGVAKDIAGRLPKAPLLTVHDSILTTPAYATHVKKLMAAGLKKYVGVTPGIKEELLTAEKEFASTTLENVGKPGVVKGVDSFAEKIFKSAVKAYKKAKRDARRRKTSPMSLAHHGLDPPILNELPQHEGKHLFSPRFYHPDWKLPENAEGQ
ncbi:hypothetical protein I2I05_19170 [Hymenobacter sp. BT683]|uniref:DNA-directed DNA polymerase family A palm domain-containing protein n=1 Tax=Hymenobacter jeongseonensis TaxID=2791027 RepID=A0ABS0IMB9_9BACT|nr:hypothetical protein [Hymenobacter jeongseonensis]MBF9239523.1 hypothetical protein [Hymenobacter jeongseonensis]